ncbi:MAG: hypothetical protein AB7K24_04230 [Gemmataceae bacterium]
MANLLRRFWSAESGIFLALWLFLMVVGQSRLFRDPGTLWHTRVGQIMLDQHRLIHTDPFSVTRGGQPWLPHQWLGELGMALLHRLAGWDSLLLATVTLLALLYTWIAHRLMRAGFQWTLAAAITILAVSVSASHFHVRPHLATLVFFAITCAAIDDFEMGRLRLARLFWLVPVYALWTNLHGGMLGGVATLGLALAGWIAFKVIGLDSPLRSWRDVPVLGLLIVACGLAAFCNPYGAELPAVWLEIMRLPQLTEIIIEHKPLEPAEADGLVTLALAAAYVLVLLTVRPRRQLRVAWLLPLVWFYLATGRIRHASLFAVAAVLALADVFPHTALARRIVTSGSDLFVPPREDAPRRRVPATAWLVPGLVVAAAFLLQVSGTQVPVVGAGWARFDPRESPVGLEPYLRYDAAGTLRPPGTPIFNDLNFGGFVIYHAPNLRVFIDDRCELFGRDLLLEYNEARLIRDPESDKKIGDWLSRFGFELALTQPGTALDAYFRSRNKEWKLIAETPAAALYQWVGN